MGDSQTGSQADLQEPFEIEIFQVGKHTSEEGSTLEFSPALIDQAIAGYDPGSFRVPLIVSHNTGSYSDRAIVDSELAYGVVDQFKRVGNKVFASFKKYVPQIKEWFNQGRLHSFSSSFYLPTSPLNPHPGKLSFRHIAALGVNPPAVKGMAAPEFQELAQAISVLDFTETEEQGVITFGCCGGCSPMGMGGENPVSAIASTIRGIRDWILASHGFDTADQIIPPYLIEKIEKFSNPEYSLMSRDVISNLWSAIDELTVKVHQVHEAHGPYTENLDYPYPGYSENLEKGKRNMGSYKKAMQNFMGKKSMTTQSFMDKMGIDDEEAAQSYMDGSKKMPDAMQKKMADFMGMDAKKFQDSYISDEETASMSENEAALRSQLEAAQAEVVRLRTEKRREEVQHFCEKHKGKFPTVIYSEPTEISFGENETAKVGIVDFMASLSDKQLAYAKEMIKSLPNTVNFKVGEEIIENGEVPQFSGTVDFDEIARLARIKAKELNISHAEAVDRVVRETGIQL